jgi:hypothetical protein
MNWRNLTDAAMDDAFKNYVQHLFDILARDPTDENVSRFKQGLENAKTAYEKLVTVLEL